MKRLAKILLTLALLAAIGWVLWVLFPSEEKKIRKQLLELAELTTFTGQEGNINRLSTASGIAGQFTLDAEIIVAIPRVGHRTFRGRDEVQQIVLAAMAQQIAVRVEFHDMVVTVAPDKQTAIAELTARINVGKEPELAVQELRFHLRKGEAGWRIERLETVQTFKRSL